VKRYLGRITLHIFTRTHTHTHTHTITEGARVVSGEHLVGVKSLGFRMLLGFRV
jgi:hypothetical protein